MSRKQDRRRQIQNRRQNHALLEAVEPRILFAYPQMIQVNGAANPLNGIDVGILSTATLGDLDSDGDLDAVLGEGNGGTLLYFKNTGTAISPVYIQQTAGANPFNGVAGAGAFATRGATIQRNQLLRPFPQFGTFGIEEYNGSDRYDAATIQMEKRFRSGNSLTAQYTRSRLRDTLNFLNPQDGVLEDRVSPNDRPNRFSIGTSLRLPFGRRERLMSEVGPDANGSNPGLACVQIPDKSGIDSALWLRPTSAAAKAAASAMTKGKFHDCIVILPRLICMRFVAPSLLFLSSRLHYPYTS